MQTKSVLVRDGRIIEPHNELHKATKEIDGVLISYLLSNPLELPSMIRKKEWREAKMEGRRYFTN